MPWFWWLGALTLVTAVGVVKGKRTRRKVWRAVRRYAEKRRKQRAKARIASRRANPRAVQRRPARSPWRPAKPVESSPIARRPVLRVQRCSAACRTSRKPASTCDCACGGRDHGRYRPGTAASVRATKYTAAQQKAQRQAVNAARSARSATKRQTALAKLPTPARGGKGGGS